MSQANDDWVSALRAIDAREGCGHSFHVLWMMLHARVFTDPEGSGFRDLNECARTIWVANVFIADVMNGGFDQFFSNSSGGHADELPQVLARVGAHKMLELYRRAEAASFPAGGTPIDRQRRSKQLQRGGKRLQAVLDDIDREFYALGPTDRPDMHEYALAHSEQLQFTKEELLAALDHSPHFLFPTDRKTCAGFDIDAREIRIQSDQQAISFPLRDVESLHIVKVTRTPAASGLVYRFALPDRHVDASYFARGLDGLDRVCWYFPNPMSPKRLVSNADVLKEIRREGDLEPVLVWSREEGSRYL